MATTRVRALTIGDVPDWLQFDGNQVSMGPVVHGEGDHQLGVMYARFVSGTVLDERAKPIPYDEVYIVLAGRIHVHTTQEEASARAGEVIFLPRGTAAVYEAKSDVELISVTHPPQDRAWRKHGDSAESRSPDPRARLLGRGVADVREWAIGDDDAVHFGEVVDETNGSALGVTFERWSAPEDAEFPPLPYDEVLVVTQGSFTVRTDTGSVTAEPGELIYLPAHSSGVYSFPANGGTMVAVTVPPYRMALRDAGYGRILDEMRVVQS
jgi:ethanolamine utilization protein EutQ (cupin superfamily)